MRDTLKKLKRRKYVTSIILVVLLIFVIGLFSILKPTIKNIKINNILTKTSSLNASVIDGTNEEIISNNYDEIKYQIKVNKDASDTAVIVATLTDSENKYARFKEARNTVVSDNGKTITITTTKNKVSLTVIVENAPYGTTIKPDITINSEDASNSHIDVDSVTITGKSVEGTVSDENGTLFKGIELSLVKNNEEVKRTYTRDNGEYVFSLGDTENYEVKIAETKYKVVRYEEATIDSNRRILNIVIKEVEPFKVEIKKTISRLDLIVNGNKQTYNYNDETKVVRSMKNAKTIEGSIYYNISIKNEGEVKGTLAVLKDIIPTGLSFDESKNPGWTKEGKYLFYTPIEGKEIDAFEKINASLVLDIVKTNEARTYINSAMSSGEDYKYIAYYLNNSVFKEEYVANSETIANIDPGVANFDGWYTDRNYTNRYNFSTPVTKDIILFGKIINNKYNVTFIDKNPNNDVETIIDIVEVEEGHATELVDAPTYDGYTFKCYELNGVCYDSDEIIEDVSLYTSYTTNNYDITYNLNGGELSESNPTTYTIKNEITLNNPSKEGYTFTGWTGTGLTEETITVTISQGSTGNREYTANYVINRYTLTVDPNGGTYNDSANPIDLENDYGYVLNLDEPVRTGYTFVGWTLSGKGTLSNNTYTYSDGDATVIANYRINTYGISYDGLTDDEKEALHNPTSYTVEDEITLANPSDRLDDDGDVYERFTGWTYGDSTSINVTIPQGSTGDRNYTANFVHVDPDVYTITYDLNGGIVSESNPSEYTKKTSTFTLNNPSKDGYIFTGWTGTGLTEETITVTIPRLSTGNRNYVANYVPINYTITYDGLTTAEIASLENPANYNIETNTFNLNNPSREGYTFAGWTGSNGDVPSNVTIPKGSMGNKTYTANFITIEYSLTYTLNGGEYETGKTNPPKYTKESDTIVLNNPSKEGYTFIGWSGTDLVGNENMTVTIPTGSIGHRSYLANYVPITYNITYDYDGGALEDGVTNPSTYTIETPDITFNNPSKEGYIFKNYTINDVITTSIPQGSMGDKALKANYEIIKYNVKYYNESDLFWNEEVDWNTTTTAPTTNPTKAHNIFLYWSEDGTNPYDFTTNIIADKNLYAVYEEVITPTITIEPSLDNETNKTWVCGDSNENNCGVTVTITSEHPEYELYYKVGDGVATLYTGPFRVYENIVVYAWSKKSDINSELTSENIVNVDTIAPTINNPGTGSMSFNMTVSGTAQDAGSGVKKFTLYVKEKEALVWDDSLTYETDIFDGIKDHAENYDHTFYGVKDNTEYIVKIVAEDYVGNISEREVEVKTHPYVARVVGKNGILWYTVDPDTKEFVIDEGKEFLLFDSLQSAVDYCANIQCTIQTNPIFPVVNEQVTVAAGQNVTIDLDGREITSSENVTFINNGKLQIVDRNPRMNGEDHESIGIVSNPTGKAIVNNNILIIGDGSSEPSETFIEPELDRPIIDGRETAIEQNKELHFYDGRIESDTLAITNNGDDVITQYSYNVIITTDEVTGQNVASMARVKDPEARIRSTYYAKLNINSAEDAVTSSRKGTVTTEQAKLLSKIKQAGDYGFIYDSVNDKIYLGNQSTANTTSLSYLKLDLTEETEDRFIVFDTLADTFNTNSYGYVSVSETFGQTGTQIYKTTGNDITGTKLYELKKGKVYYIYFGFVKGGGDINKYENFEISNFRLLGSKQETTDLRIYSDNTNYPFVKQNDGSYESSNYGIDSSYSHSYLIYDLRNQTEQINLYVNVSVDSHPDNDIGYIYLSDNEVLQGPSVTTGRYTYISGSNNDVTYTIPLVPGQVNYVHFAYWKNHWRSDGTDRFVINSISLSKTKGEELIPSSTATNDGTYYFKKADYEPYKWKDSSSNGYNATLTGVLYDEEKKGFYFNGAHIGSITAPNYSLTDYEESVYVEYSTTSTSNAVFYGGTSNEKLAIGQYNGYILITTSDLINQYARPATYADGNKHNLMATYKDGVYKLYYDGEELQQASHRNRYSWSNTNSYIGALGNGSYYYTGYIYNIKVFNKELTPEELNNTENLMLNLDGNNAKVTADNDIFISNNHNITSSTAHSYLTYDLTNVNEDKYLYINTSISSQSGYDFGYVQVTDSTDIPTNLNKSEIKVSGELDNQYKVFKLKKNQVNYVHFLYVKDNWGNTGLDRFVIKEVKYCNTLADAYSVNPTNYDKVNTAYFEKANLNTDVDTIELLKDITLDNSIVIPQEKEVVLDLNGFTITSNINDYIIKNSGKLTIKDSTYDEKHSMNVDYVTEQARLFAEAKERYLSDVAEYEKYTGLCDGCEPSAQYIYDQAKGIEYSYDGNKSQKIKLSSTGTYKIEVWGAEGGRDDNATRSGYGGYSVGYLNGTGQLLYLTVGQQGSKYDGGYNGGGTGGFGNNQWGYGGGGATHIATTSGEISTLYANKKSIYMVAGGGGGSGGSDIRAFGSSGGGYNTKNGFDSHSNRYDAYNGSGANQTTAGWAINCGTGSSGQFGRGADFCNSNYGGTGGGGGYYGGGGSNRGHGGGGGGSGFIDTTVLTNAEMYCYDCNESTEPETKTTSTTCVEAEPTANCAKKGDGFAKITLIKTPEEIEELEDNIDKTYTITEEPNFIDYLDGIDFDGTININQLTPESTPTYNNPTVETRDGAITSTIANAIFNDDYAKLKLDSGVININVNSKIAIENRGDLEIKDAVINANNTSTIGVFNETNANISFVNGTINANGSSSIGLLHRGYQSSLNNAKIVTAQTNAVGLSNESLVDTSFSNLDISGSGVGFKEYSVGNTSIINSNIKSTGNGSVYNTPQALNGKLEINSSNLYGPLYANESSKNVLVNTSTLTSVYNYWGNVKLYNSDLSYIDNRGEAVLDKVTMTGNSTLILNYASGMERSYGAHHASMLLKNSILTSTSTDTNTKVITNRDVLNITNTTIYNIKGIKSTAINNEIAGYNVNYNVLTKNTPYLTITNTINIDPSFGTAIYNTGIVTLGSDRGNYETEYTYAYTGKQEEFIAPADGLYKLETWGAGAAGAFDNRVFNGGYGGYASGTISLHAGDKLYIHVGGIGSTGWGTYSTGYDYYSYVSGYYGAYNGGQPVSKGSYWGELRMPGAGGGATDISLSSEDNEWVYNNGITLSRRSVSSYEQRILVAGGGSGCNLELTCHGGYNVDPSASQLGIGYGLGGGGGYYGGTSTLGGSSYAANTLTDVVLIPGNAEMPNYNSGTMVGNRGGGYARISLVDTSTPDTVTTAPVITATDYGINGSGELRFLDGTINAKTAVNSDIHVVPDNYDIYNSKDSNNNEKMILVANADSRPVGQGQEEFVAAIGNAKYTTIQNALDASNNGDEIDLLVNIEQQNKITIPANKIITIDYNGHTVKSYNPDCLFENLGDLTIKDSTNALGKNTFTGDRYILNKGTLSLNNIYIVNNSYMINIIANETGTITMNGVKIDVSDLGDKHAIKNSEDGTMVVQNSTFNMSYKGIMFGNYGTLTINNSNLYNHLWAYYQIYNYSTGTLTYDNNVFTFDGHNGNGNNLMVNEGTTTIKNTTHTLRDLPNSGTLILEDNTIPTSTITSTGLVIINSGTYNNTFTINDGGKTIDNTENLYSFIMNGGTLNTTLNLNTTNISNIEGGKISVTSGYAINNTAAGTINLGVHDGVVETKITTRPSISGKSYGIYTSNASLIVNFYDGIVSGTRAYNVTIGEIESGYSIHREFDSDNNIETKYLTQEAMFINDTHDAEYNTISELNTALSNGSIVDDDVIKVYRDITITNNDNPITIPSGLKITFDTNGKIVDKNNDLMFIINGELDAIDGTINSTGKIDSTTGDIFVNNGTLKVISGNYVSEQYTAETEIIKNNVDGIVNISGGTFTKYYDYLGFVQIVKGSIVNNSGTANVTGGTFYTSAAHSMRLYYIFSSVTFNNASTGTLTVTGGDYDGIMGFSRDYSGNLTSHYKTFSSQDSQSRGTLVYNYGTASIKNITSNQSNIGYNSGTLTLDNITMNNIYQMNENGWNNASGGTSNLINTGTVDVINSSFEIKNSFADNKGGTLNITNTTIDRTADGINMRNYDDKNNSGLEKTSQVLYNYSTTGEINVVNSTLYNRGTGDVIYNKATVNIEDSTLEAAANNVIVNTGATLNVKGNTSIVSNSGNYSGITLSNSSTLNLGEPIEVDGEVSQSKPFVKGVTYGINNSGSTFNFYDGLIEGTTLAFNGTFSNLESGYIVIYDTDGDYKTNYLDRIPIVQNITQATAQDEKKYYDLKTAFAEANDNDTLRMIANYSSLPTDETAVNDRIVTFDLNGKVIRQSNSILIQNNGTLNLTDNSQDGDGYILLLSGTNIISNDGIINFIGGKLSSNLGGSTIIKNVDPASVLTVKDNAIMDSSTTAILIDNSGTTNVYNGAYLHNVRTNGILNRNTLYVVDLNNDNDNSTSSSLKAPWIYSENEYNDYHSQPYTIQTYQGSTTTIYGGIYGATDDLNTQCAAQILSNAGTAYVYNLNTNVYVFASNNGTMTVENSHFYFSNKAIVYSSGTLDVNHSTFEISDTYWSERIFVWGGTTTFDDVTITSKDSNTTYGGTIFRKGDGVFNLKNSTINVNISDMLIRNDANKLLIQNSNIISTNGIYNKSATVEIDASNITTTNYIANVEAGTFTVKNNSTLTSLNSYGLSVYNSAVLNINDDNTIIANNGAAINLNHTAKFTLGEMGGTPSTEHPYVEGSTFGVRSETYTTTFNFYDGLIVGKTGPNAVFGGVTNVESEYEIENVLVTNPDTGVAKYNEYLVHSASYVAVAKVANYTFTSVGTISPSQALQNAINFAIGDGTNVSDIDLLTNVDLVNDQVSITASMPVTINLYGNTINQSSTYNLSSNITLNNNNNLGGSISKLLSDVFDLSQKPKDIVIYELSDGSVLDTTKTYKLYRDGSLISLEKEELGRYRYKGDNEDLIPIKGRLYIDNLQKGSYRLESSDNKYIEFSIDSDGNISGNVTENTKSSDSSTSVAESKAEVILTIQTGIKRHYYWLFIIPIVLIISLLIIIKHRKREI